MTKKHWLTLLLAVILTELTGSLSGFLAGDIRASYAALNQIPLAPSGNLFGIVWPLLYLMMSISLFLIIAQEKPTRKRNAYGLYGLQLLLNFSWSLIFFGGSQLWLAVAVIAALDLTVACQIYYYRKISSIAAYLLVPYFLWLLFATYLNIGFALVN